MCESVAASGLSMPKNKIPRIVNGGCGKSVQHHQASDVPAASIAGVAPQTRIGSREDHIDHLSLGTAVEFDANPLLRFHLINSRVVKVDFFLFPDTVHN